MTIRTDSTSNRTGSCCNVLAFALLIGMDGSPVQSKITVSHSPMSAVPKFTINDGEGTHVTQVVVLDESMTAVWMFVRDEICQESEDLAELTHIQIRGSETPVQEGEPVPTGEMAAPSKGELGAQLSEFTFGEVPPGFRQAIPAGVTVPALQSGITYRVFILGLRGGTVTFNLQ